MLANSTNGCHFRYVVNFKIYPVNQQNLLLTLQEFLNTLKIEGYLTTAIFNNIHT